MMRLLILALTAALILGTPSHTENHAQRIDTLFNWATPHTPGCSVAVSHEGETVVTRAYGLADLERNVRLSPDSLLDVGSVQKQFTAASILLLVEEELLALDDDIREYIPELPDYGQKVTIDHLLTHTSGIRDWTGLMPLAEGDPDVLTLILRQRNLDFAPGDQWSYSNSGYELLKEIVARRSGMSFSEFTRTRLFEPLGMKSTTYVTDSTQVVRSRALAYRKAGEGWRHDIRIGNNRGGGALLSTASELLIWSEALAGGHLGEFVSTKIHEPVALNNGRKPGYARGLRLRDDADGRSVSHSGGAGGYSALLSRYPDHRLSVAILCNADGAARGAYSARIFDLFVPPAGDRGDAVADRPATRAVAAGLEGFDPNSRAGLYFSERSGEPLRLVVTSGALAFERGPRLVALSRDRFRTASVSPYFMSGDQPELQFLSDGQFELKSTDGSTTRFRRPRRWTPAAADLHAFAGRYESEELGSSMEIVPEEGGLVMRFHRSPQKAFPFAPVEPDLFMVAGVTLHFVRNASGEIVGYDLGNPVVRNLRFTRLRECAGER
jgi:CubicO group peptidase (beta-lactamase class C family)